MTKDEDHRFDLVATTTRLEDWFLEHVAFPVGDGLVHWPAGRSHAIGVLLMELWARHAEWYSVKDGRRGICPEIELNALGVALAVLEIHAHEVGSREFEEVEWLRQAESITSIRASIRAELRALADHIPALPLSRAVLNRSGGRPKALLANAVAQQLRAGGFSEGMIARFMDSTVGAVRARWKTDEARSLANVFGACP
jgi:hypothetical protein